MADYVTSITDLIGDFYQSHASDDRAMRDEALSKIQERLKDGTVDSQPFIDYYNDIFSGRTSYNTLLNIADYPKESIIRELLQNTFGCCYDGNDIKIIVDFAADDEIHISYNETGFTLEDVLFYLSFGRNNGDETREGRFGVGAKSVFMNVEWLSLKSNNFSFRIEHQEDHLHITELDMHCNPFKGTVIKFKVSHEEYESISENFKTLTEKRGRYINLVELCFAFNRKKILNIHRNPTESIDRTLNLAVMEHGQLNSVYKITRYQKSDEDTPVIRFMQNNKGVIDFLYYENAGFVYLIPYAVANAKRESVVHILMEKYNYFSTFELTGLLRADSEVFIDEKLSAFFVSVPNAFITSCRTGIRADAEEKIGISLENDLGNMLRQYRKHFVLDLRKKPDEDYYFMFPKSYAFEFFKGFMQTSRYASRIKNDFINSISLNFPGEAAPTGYEILKKTAFKASKIGVSKAEVEDGSADHLYIDAEIEKLEEKIKDVENRAVYAGYEWENEDGSEKGRNYIYKFVRGANTYIVDSRKTPKLTDYEFYAGFPSVIGFMLDEYLGDDGVGDEVALENIFMLFDDACSENYTIAMKYYRFNFDTGTEKFAFEVSKINIENLKNAMDSVARRKNRFTSTQNYNEVVAMLVNSFTQGKDTKEFMRTIRDQGGVISLELDFNKKYRLAVYGKQFMIPSTITNGDLLDIIGDTQQLISSNILNGRNFDFPYSASKYSFDRAAVASLLSSDAENIDRDTVKEVLDKLYVCNLKSDHIALVDAKGKIISIKEINSAFTDDEREKAVKYVILRDDYSKPEYADVLEYIITGKNEHILNRFFSRTKEPNQVIPDQIPYELKLMPSLTRREMDYVLGLYSKIAGDKDKAFFKNYFAKDINSKVFGYGGKCSACGYESDVINCFTVKDFSIELMTEDGERIFNFALYLCNNDTSVSDGWLINDISIGGMQPFKWLEEIASASIIPPEFLFCRIKYRPQLTYDIMSVDASQCLSVVDAPLKTLDVKLTPLMAAKWIADNR